MTEKKPVTGEEVGVDAARAALARFGSFDASNAEFERAPGQSFNNDVWRVTAGGPSWTLRLGRADDTLGFDPRDEMVTTTLAASLGVAPRLVDTRDGAQLLEWIDARPWVESDLGDDGARRFVQLVRRAHVSSPHGLPTLSDRIETMLECAAARGARIPDGADAPLRRVRSAEPANPVLTHHDV